MKRIVEDFMGHALIRLSKPFSSLLKKVIYLSLLKNAQMQHARYPEAQEMKRNVLGRVRRSDEG